MVTTGAIVETTTPTNYVLVFVFDNLGQVFHRNFGVRASSVEPSGNHRPPVRESFLALSLSRVCPTQEETYHLKMWKLSMKESDWNNNDEVVLDMKSDARHFREERGFEVPPPPSLSSSVQLELAISLSSCNLSSPDGPSSVASQTPTIQNVCHPCCGSRVCSLCVLFAVLRLACM